VAGKSFTNQEISQILTEIAAAFEVKGDDQFRIRAYQNAADAIEHSTQEVKNLWERNKLTSIPGVGAGLASHLDELFKTGTVKHFTQVKKSLPAGMFPLLTLPGIGPKTAYKLSKKLKLTDSKTAVNKLKKAASEGKIAGLEGFAQKSQAEILETIKQDKKTPKNARLRLDKAHLIANDIIQFLKQSSDVQKVFPMGSLRRRNATVGDIDIGVATLKPQEVVSHIKTYSKIKEVLASGEGVVRFLHENKQQIDIKIVKPDSFGALLQHFTGSKSHNIHLRELALKKKFSLSEYGIKVKGKLKPTPTEKEFYATLGLDWIPPELREDRGEIEAAKTHKLPQLVKLKDIKGDLHIHTNYDWISSHDAADYNIKDLIKTSINKSYEYIAIGDHNPSQSSYSQSQIISQVKKRSEQIKSTMKTQVKSRVLNILISLEVDIKPDGSLALPDQSLKSLDFIIASIHSSMKMDKAKMTERILKAISHPKVKILGHPTGHLFNRRESYDLDWDQIFLSCKKHQVALEINSYPARLDVNDLIVKEAISKDIKIAINTDAHSISELDHMQYGIDVARRGWAKSSDIINTYTWTKLKDWLKI